MRKKPLVSVIITTKNEEDVIADLLQSLKKQTYPNIEVILVDNSSKDKTKKIAKSFNTKIFNYGPERSAQRNYGAKKSAGKYLFFLDADMLLAKRVINDCIKKIDNSPKIAGLIVPEISVANNFWGRIKAFERSFYNAHGDSITDAARFFRKSVFDEVKGYDEQITGPEDWDLPEVILEKGYRFGRIKSLITHKERIKGLVSLCKKKYYYAKNADSYLKKHHISKMSPKTLYFLRPVFYRQWQKIVENPVLSFGMFLMLTGELIAGGLGYLVGKMEHEKA